MDKTLQDIILEVKSKAGERECSQQVNAADNTLLDIYSVV